MSEQVVLSPALGAWLALRRLDHGRVMFHHGHFFDNGRPVPDYLTAPLCRLLDRGLAQMDGSYVLSNESGRALYRELCQARGIWLATNRAVPFGSATAQLLAEGDRR